MELKLFQEPMEQGDIWSKAYQVIPNVPSKHERNRIFGMAAMPFPCSGILLIQGNLLRVIQVVFQMYRSITN